MFPYVYDFIIIKSVGLYHQENAWLKRFIHSLCLDDSSFFMYQSKNGPVMD